MQDLDHQTTTNNPATDPVRHSLPAEDPDDPNDPNDPDDLGPSHLAGLTPRRAAIILGLLLLLVLMAVVPPLINVGRYRRRIATSIGLSLGRPVHIDSVTLNILPMPGFTLENFVVQEDPAFGAEPVIRAQQVRATLRINSLWSRRVEFSRISLNDPSVNLVHLPNGQWNLDSILLQASRMPAAPTQQRDAGEAPRFPYIEATGGRLNIKMGLEKLPISLTDAEFALWLPEPRHWHLRLKAAPSRTDSASTDSGLVRIEGTLGQAPTLAGVPLDLAGRWTAAPLGAVSRVLMGRDAGMRGQMTLTTTVRGTMSDNQVQSRLELRSVRRADFVPDAPIDADISCTAAATQLFHTLSQLTCAWPFDPSDSSNTPGSGLIVTGSLPNLFHPASAVLNAQVTALPDSALLHLLHVWNQRISPAVQVAGTLAAQLTCCTAVPPPPPAAPVPGSRRPALSLTPAPPSGPFSGTITLTQPRLAAGTSPPFVAAAALTGSVAGPQLSQTQLILPAIPLNLGGKDPALVELRADLSGYSLHLTGTVLPSRWTQLTRAIPPLGDGIQGTPLAPPPPTAAASQTVVVPHSPANPQPATPPPDVPIHVDLTSHRLWGSTQSWSATTPPTPPTGPRKKRPPF